VPWLSSLWPANEPSYCDFEESNAMLMKKRKKKIDGKTNNHCKQLLAI
jgi:hypothetical protein